MTRLVSDARLQLLSVDEALMRLADLDEAQALAELPKVALMLQEARVSIQGPEGRSSARR